MFDNDLVRRLPLINERRDDIINDAELLFGKADTLPGITECFTVFPVCKDGIVPVLMGNSASDMTFVTAIANIGSTDEPLTTLLLIILTMLITRRTGCTLDVAKNDFATNICLLAMIPVYAKVLGVKKKSFPRVVIRQPVGTNLLGDGTRILTEVLCNLFERDASTQCTLYILSVRSSQMFMVAWNILAHDELLPLLSEAYPS